MWLELNGNRAEPGNQTGLRDTLLEKSTVLCGHLFRRAEGQKSAEHTRHLAWIDEFRTDKEEFASLDGTDKVLEKWEMLPL